MPATPDPYDDATSDAHRQAVLDLLPGRPSPTEATPVREPADEGPATEQVPVAVEAPARTVEAVPVEAMVAEARPSEPLAKAQPAGAES